MVNRNWFTATGDNGVTTSGPEVSATHFVVGFYAMNTPESLLVNGSIHMDSIDDYIEHSIWSESHHHSGFLGFGSKDETTTTERFYRMFYAHTYSLVLSLKQIGWYSLSLMEFPLPEFNSVFKMSLDYLPKK